MIYISFKINQIEIAETFCVLRKQMKNTCKGNCVLRAELKKQTENDQKRSTLLKEKEELIYTITKTEYNLTPIFIEIDKKISFYNPLKPKLVSFTIFHPPTA